MKNLSEQELCEICGGAPTWVNVFINGVKVGVRRHPAALLIDCWEAGWAFGKYLEENY
jgi:hypothetical protein